MLHQGGKILEGEIYLFPLSRDKKRIQLVLLQIGFNHFRLESLRNSNKDKTQLDVLTNFKQFMTNLV